MTDEQIKQKFKETYPDYMLGDTPLSPYWDIWCYAIELAEEENKRTVGYCEIPKNKFFAVTNNKILSKEEIEKLPFKIEFVKPKNKLKQFAIKYLRSKKMNKNITNKQLAEWLAQGKGEWKHEPSNSGKVYDFYWFDPKDADKRITINEEGQRIVVRKYGDSEWHSPTEDYCFEE